MSLNDAFIIGYGVVGQATAKSLNIPFYFDLTDSNITLEEGAKKQWCFICTPTPTDEKGNQTEGRKIIHDYIAQLTDYGFKGIIVIRSTVIPGTCKAFSEEFKVKVASCPETLSEDTWEKDAVKPRIIILGADSNETRKELVNLWKDVPCKIRVVTDTVTSETLKYAFNTFFLTKIIWANQMYDVCLKNGARFKVIREALHQHPWGSKHHFKPVHKNGRGGGGKCLPKDIKAFASYSNLKFFKVVEELNNEYLKESKKQ
jgi:nucleotide sugar dehydrogenase